MLRQRAGMDTPKEKRKELYDEFGGHVINGLYRQKFDFELFFYYLDNNVEQVERQIFYEKIIKELTEKEQKCKSDAAKIVKIDLDLDKLELFKQVKLTTMGK